MSSTNEAVFHRRNKQIQDAIDGQNLKQALQLIEKRMKKGENTRFLRAWRAHVLFRHSDQTHCQRGIAETLQLCNMEPPTTDLDTLDILHQTLERMDGHEGTLRDVWEKAAKTKPQDLEIQMRWFTYAFEDDAWKSAQKAAMSLQSNFPKTRKYHFWAILLTYLVAVDPSSSDAERKLFGTLAYRMVSKAADSVPSNPKELLSSPRAIQNAEELFLLIRIFESQDRHTEIVKILDSPNLGLSSRIVQNDWSLIREKLLSLEKAGLWAEGLSYARELLTLPSDEAERRALQERDDWNVWNLLVTATQNLNALETTAETQKFIDEFIKLEPKSRNAHLALLDLVQWRVQSTSIKSQDLVTACQEYFDRNRHKLYCFGDLRKYVTTLDRSDLLQILEYTAKSVENEDDSQDKNKGVPKINALKLEYCFLLPSTEDSALKQRTEDFVSRCLQAYRKAAHLAKPKDGNEASSTIESQPSDDLCLLAAMSLIRFSGTWHNGNQEVVPDTALIRAAGILERLLLDSPHNYQALLLLVRIYLCLGAGSLALKTFSKLSVKQLQYETVAHNLFTRLATIHPHSAPPIEGAESKDFSPQSAFVQALNFFRNAGFSTLRSRTGGLDHGSYVNVKGCIDLQRLLKNSICRRMWALDVRRMQRLVGGDPMSRYDELAKDPSSLADQRDFSAFMNCEAPGKLTVEERVRLGPLPRDQWIKSARLTDQLFSLLKNIAIQKPPTSGIDPPSVDDLVGSDMTAAEVESAKANLNLLKIASFISGSKSVTSEEANKCLAETEEWLVSKSKHFASSTFLSETAISIRSKIPSAPSWRYFHEVFSVLETLKAVSQLASLSSKKASKSAALPKDRVERIVTVTHEIYETIRSSVHTLKSRISESGTLGALIDLVMAGEDGTDGPEDKQLRSELDATLDTSALELFCGSLMESWEENLDGVLKVRL